MEANQKILYEKFKKESEENKDPIIREKCKKAATDILKSFPQFEVKDNSGEEEKPAEEVKSKRKK